MKQRILILGGNRFFGRHLAGEQLKRGADVTLLNRGNSFDALGSRVQRLRADRSNHDDLAKALGNSTWDLVYDQICYNGADATALARLLKGRTERLIFTSTQSVYGMGYRLKENLYDPTRYVPPNPPDDSYGALKRQAEAAYAEHPNLNVTMVRIPIVLGTDDYTGRLKWHIERVLRGLPIRLANSKARLGFVRSDVAGRLLADLGGLEHRGPVNCACPGDIAVGEIVSRAEHATGKKAILAEDESDASASSPFGAGEDWTMNLELMKELGLEAPELETWFDPLVQQLTEALKKTGAKG